MPSGHLPDAFVEIATQQPVDHWDCSVDNTGILHERSAVRQVRIRLARKMIDVGEQVTLVSWDVCERHESAAQISDLDVVWFRVFWSHAEAGLSRRDPEPEEVHEYTTGKQRGLKRADCVTLLEAVMLRKPEFVRP